MDETDEAVRTPGRPRDPSIDDAVLEAAERLLVEGGIEAVTMSAVAATTGLARATLYRRWPGRDRLVTAVIRHAMGRPPVDPPADPIAALYEGAEVAREVLASRRLRPLVPLIAEGLLAPPTSGRHLDIDQLVPGRARVIAAVDAGAVAAGIRSDVTGEHVVDLVLGMLIWRLIAGGRPPSAAETRRVVGTVLDGARTRTAAQ